MLIAGDFNLDQMFPEHVSKADPLIQKFNLSQHSQYSTCVRWGILDLVCDTYSNIYFKIPILFLLCNHPKVITLFFFSKSYVLYLYRI